MSELKSNKTRVLINFFGVVAIIVLLNVLAGFFNKRVDLTEDNRYSLSENTKQLLKDNTQLKDRVFFKIYLDGDIPADMKNIQSGIQNMLEEFVADAGDMIQYEFIDPDGSDDDLFNKELKENLFDKGKGILPTNLKQFDGQTSEISTIWPGAVVEYGGQTVDVIQFFDREEIIMDEDVRHLVDNTISQLEYKFISSIRRVTREAKKSIGFLQGHGELTKYETWDVRQSLEKDYIIDDVEIKGQLNAFIDLDALVIAKPTESFNEKDKFIIDQFIMNGGKVMWFIDPLEVNRDSLAYTGETICLARDLNIEKDLLYKYGVRLNNDIIFDQQCTHELIPPRDVKVPGLKWGFYPLLSAQEHPITLNIDPIKTEYISSVTPVNISDTSVKKIVLLQSSIESIKLMAPARINFGFAYEKYAPKTDNPKFANNPVAVLLEGEFSSPFENRISDSFFQDNSFKTKYKSVPNKMLIVADGDMINSSFTYHKQGQKKIAQIPLSVDRFRVMTANGTQKFHFGNREFFLNAVDYLLGDNSLIGIRSKTISLRLLDAEKVRNERSFWKFINIVFPLLFIVIFGVIQYVIRKRKYTK